MSASTGNDVEIAKFATHCAAAATASALAVAAAAQWVANFAISTTFPVLADIGLSFAYAFYAFFALLSLFFVFYKIPETRGKELEDMRDDFVIKRGHIVESA